MRSRGLTNFINELVNPNSKIDPNSRVMLELLKIKKAFLSEKITPYNRKKYIAKLCFIVLNGYHSVDFGFSQISTLLTSKKYSDIRIGWMALVIVCGQNRIHDIIPDIRKQLLDAKNEPVVSLALTGCASIGGTEITEAFGPLIADIAIKSESPHLRSRALVTLSRLYSNSKQLPIVDLVVAQMPPLLNRSDPTICLSSASLILSLLESNVPQAINILPTILHLLQDMIFRSHLSFHPRFHTRSLSRSGTSTFYPVISPPISSNPQIKNTPKINSLSLTSPSSVEQISATTSTPQNQSPIQTEQNQNLNELDISLGIHGDRSYSPIPDEAISPFEETATPTPLFQSFSDSLLASRLLKILRFEVRWNIESSSIIDRILLVLIRKGRELLPYSLLKSHIINTTYDSTLPKQDQFPKDKSEKFTEKILSELFPDKGAKQSVIYMSAATDPVPITISPSQVEHLDIFLQFFLVFSEAVELSASVPLPDITQEELMSYLIELLDCSQECVIAFALDALCSVVRNSPRCVPKIHSQTELLFEMISSRNPLLDSRALCLLYNSTTSENGQDITHRLIKLIPTVPFYLRNTLAIDCAVLVQSFFKDAIYCVDTLIFLLERFNDSCTFSGPEVSSEEELLGSGFGNCDRETDSIWISVARAILSLPQTQPHAVHSLLKKIREFTRPSEGLLRLAIIIFGEFPKSEEDNPLEALDLLARRSTGRPACLALLASTLWKVAFRCPELEKQCKNALKRLEEAPWPEAAQRAHEYGVLLETPREVQKRFFDVKINTNCPMKISTQGFPPSGFPEKEEVQTVCCLDWFSEIYRGKGVIIFAKVEFDQPKAKMWVKFEIDKNISLENVEIVSCPELEFSIQEIQNSGNVLQIVKNDEKTIKEMVINFVAKEPFIKQPKVRFTVVALENLDDIFRKSAHIFGKENKRVIEAELPLTFAQWMKTRDYNFEEFISGWDEMGKSGFTKMTYIPVPDGNAIITIQDFMKKKIGLENLHLQGLPISSFASAGEFICAQKTFNCFLRFDFDTEELTLQLTIRAKEELIVQLLLNLIKNVFTL